MSVKNNAQQEELYDVMKQLLPQLESELREELQAKYAKIFMEKEKIIKRQFQEAFSKKLEAQILQKQQKMQAQYQKILEEKIRKQQKKRENYIGKQAQQMKQKIYQLQKQNQILLQQQANWIKLQKGYQKAIKDFRIDQQNSSICNISNPRIKPNSNQDFSKLQLKNETQQTLTMNIPSYCKTKPHLLIQTQSQNQMTERGSLFKTPSLLFYGSDQTDQNHSQVRGILSPPSTDPYLIDSVLEYTANPGAKPQSKPMYWNQQKKQELLKMIRLRMN